MGRIVSEKRGSKFLRFSNTHYSKSIQQFGFKSMVSSLAFFSIHGHFLLNLEVTLRIVCTTTLKCPSALALRLSAPTKG